MYRHADGSRSPRTQDRRVAGNVSVVAISLCLGHTHSVADGENPALGHLNLIV